MQGTPKPAAPAMMTKSELAAELRISARQIDKLRSMGRLPVAIKIGRSVRWRAADVADFIRAGCVVTA